MAQAGQSVLAGQRLLAGQSVLVVGGGRHLGAAVARAAAAAGAGVVIGARDVQRAAAVAAGLPGARAIRLDVADEETVAAAAAELGGVDHVVVTAAAHHNVPVAQLEHDRVVAALEAKVVGPMLLAKHLAPTMPSTGSFVLFSGVAAWAPAAGYTVMGITNGAVSFLARHLAKELAPIRVNAISPGIVDSGTWDELGPDGKRGLLEAAAASNLAGRAGTSDDVVEAVLWLLGAGFVSGETIHVEGGARHA
ncbi:3-oxoacyl-[acyl-carrier-protein] reductase FabG [Cellulomonas sp. T2.31MG-18]|uniref:SDR family oxidoreductase n=1 Tax=Cellulomonas sp. T2.31MG-18 TaxID=3157619 RepID=UPI0035E4BF7F